MAELSGYGENLWFVTHDNGRIETRTNSARTVSREQAQGHGNMLYEVLASLRAPWGEVIPPWQKKS